MQKQETPEEIAEHLCSEHGRTAALAHVMEQTQKAHRMGDNYTLSVWRDVKRILADTEQPPC